MKIFLLVLKKKLFNKLIQFIDSNSVNGKFYRIKKIRFFNIIEKGTI